MVSALASGGGIVYYTRQMKTRVLVNRIGGGLGNQMFSYALVENLARKLNAVQVYDTTDFFVFRYLVPQKESARDFQLLHFKGPRRYRKWGALKSYLFLLVWIIGKKAGWRAFEKIVNLLGMHWWHSSGIFETSFPEIPDDGKTVYCCGMHPDVTKMPDAEVLRNEFALADPLSAESASIERQIQECESVSIHVRRTDYLSQAQPWALDFSYYERAIEHIAKEIENPKWFIFSDDTEWCRDRFSFLAAPDVKIIDFNATRPWEDLHLMRICKHHIIANSTFSWWAAYLAEERRGMTLCPDKWGPYVEKTPDAFYRNGWIAIDSGPSFRKSEER